MSINNTGSNTKHVANFSSNNTISGDLELSGDIISGGQRITLPTNPGSADSFLRNDGTGLTSWQLVTMNILSDTLFTSLSTNDFMKYNGSNWINTVLSSSDVGLGNVTNESKATMFTAPTFTGNVTLNGVTYTFPVADGSSGQFLSTNSSGVLSWQSAAGGGIDMNGLTDTTITTPASGDIISYTGAGFENTKPNIRKTRIYTTAVTLALDDSDDYVGCTTTSNLIITLPDVVTNSGKSYIIQKLGNAGTITINVNGGSDTINGSLTSYTLTSQHDFIEFLSNGYVTDPIWLTI